MTTDKTALVDELKILNNNIEAIQEVKARIEGFLFGNKSSCFKIDRKSLEEMAEMFCVIGDYMKTLRPLLADIRFPTQKNGCCDIDPDRCAGMCEDAVEALNKLGDSSSLPDIERNDCETIIRAALAPVDVDAGLRALDYQRDLAFIFMVAKGSKDYDETIGDRIERVQELILQLKKQNDYLAARGCFWGWQPIETAPKDGTWIMVYWPTMGIGQYPFVVFWDEGWQPARYSDRDYGEAFPTHWMPLPAAPKKEGV